MKRAVSLAAVSLAALSLSACATDGGARLGTVKDPVSFSQTERDYDASFSARPAVQRVRVPGGLFVSRPQDATPPSSLMDKRVEIDIRSEMPTLADLQTLLDIQGVPMTIDWRSLEEGSTGKSDVGSFTAASRYQDVANSVSGGTGIQQNNNGGGFGGGGYGNNGGSFGGNSGYGGNSGSGFGSNTYGSNGGGGFGGNSGGYGGGGNYGGGNGGGANVRVEGAASEGGSGSSSGSNSNSQGTQAIQESDQRQQSALNRLPGGSGSGGSRTGASGGSGSGGRQLPAFYDRALPFRYFKGTVGELMRRLENTGNIAVWYDGGLVVGDVRRYSVSVMQNKDIVQSIVNELIRLGAKDVMGSVGAGQVSYSAPPRTNGEIIEPYLRRLQGNLSEVTLQVALVTVSMTHSAEAGFDWSAFNFGYGSNVTSGTTAGGTSTGGSGGTGAIDPVTGLPTAGTPTGGTGAANQLANGVFTLNNNGLNANLGDLLGTGKIVSVAGAIKFLSRLGSTSVAQNVEMRTLSGSPVILRSGESIPYVQNVGTTIAGGLSGSALGSSQTASIGTGLTLNVDPRYDSTSGIVTMDVGLKLVDLVEFVQLNAGAQLGTLTQPRTREQGINSILRLEAGQTAILGGIRRDLTSDNRTGPLDAFAIGSRTRSREVFWLFAIVRPVVTVYETADAPQAPRSVLDTYTTVNPLSDGSYGATGRPGKTTSLRGDPQVSSDSGTPTYYRHPGSSTPANRLPAGVITASPPAPRDIIVPNSATSVEVDANVPQGAVIRDPGSPSTVAKNPPNQPDRGSSAVRREPVPTQNPPIQTAPAQAVRLAPTTAPAQDAPQAPVQEKRSFIRPMTESEQGNN